MKKKNEMIKIKAYKVFNPDWKCRDFQYKIGKTFKLTDLKGNLIEPEMCSYGFHACVKIANCFSYYSFDSNNKVAEVELSGTVLGLEENKQCSNVITIVKELSWNEVLLLANTGKNNTGYSNSGYSNSGYSNSGYSNSGNSNSGNSNSGNSNSGDRNSGNSNSGDRNSGDSNSGYSNSGDRNSGDSNSGYSNSGDRNSGNSNSGYSNSGYSNSGDRNSGDRNSGYSNSGDRNSGDFNSTTPDVINCFNEPCKTAVWDNAEKPNFIYFDLTEWISFDDMSDEEKKEYPKAFVCDGYLKTYGYKEAWAKSYAKATPEDIRLLKALPNFDKKVFFEITGIKIK